MKTCPHCRKTFPAPPPEIKNQMVEPNDGDVTLCTRCGEFSIFDEEASGGIRRPNEFEARRLKAIPHLNALRDRWRRLQ